MLEMPNTLPVPSKAALRTLRRIALGTSCTVAFTTGLLTEDRRRRIHAAREVHNNAKLLKSSRKYHSGVSLTTESFEDQAMRYSDNGLLAAKDSHNIQPAQVTLPDSSVPDFLAPRHGPQPLKISKYKLPSSSNVSRHQLLDQITIPQTFAAVPVLPATPDTSQSPRLRKVVYKPGESAWASSRYQQKKIAANVTSILENKEERSTTEAAALQFFEAAKGLRIEGLGIVQELVDTAEQLSKACQLEGKFDVSEKIFVVIAGFGPVDEDTFHSLGVEGVVRHLVTGLDHGNPGNIATDVSKLQRAVALYLTKFKERPGTSTDSWRELGEILCAETHHYELLDLTEKVYWRLEKIRGDAPNTCVHHLMGAIHKQGRHKDVVKTFRRLFPNAHLSKSGFYTTGDLVIESALQLRRFDMAEEALLSLVKMSEDAGLLCSTTWLLKILGADWRTYHDISRTRALFERVEPCFELIVHPQAAYGAMIQFCVEAGDEAAARWYYEYKVDKIPAGSAFRGGIRLETRIQGHFAYAKAMRSDWAGVKEDFCKMRQLSPETLEFSASFTPIFKLFARSHPVNETEDFIRTFIDQGFITLTPQMSTTLIDKYGAAGEIDSISRWLDYMASVQSHADSAFFNTIIHNCRTKWNFSFEETYRLFRRVRDLGGPAARFISKDTISILRRSAMAGSERNIADTVNRLNRLKLDQPLTPPIDSKNVQEHMAIAMAKGSPRRALRIYDKAQKGLVPVAGACISTAVQAVLAIDPNDIYGAASLLRKPHKDGHDISAAVAIIFVHQLSYHCPTLLGRATQVQDIARKTIYLLEKQGVDVPPSVVTHTVHTLVSGKQYYQAIDFWKSMAANQKATSSPDLPTLTVLLQAYIGVRDCAGVDWVIQMVSVNNLFPDRRFRQILRATLSGMKEHLELNPNGHLDPHLYDVVENALRSVSAIRDEVAKSREHVKTMTIKIMEKAIEIDMMLGSVKAENISKSSVKVPVFVSAEERSSTSTSERSLGICTWRPVEDPDHYLPPVGQLVGLQAG
ncbi:hypothetical protein D0Z07_3274 [Hyphodiscus hymeniophilus]|uniref:Pentatricopeptide repeat protein n=1 Tax=Hyphodiscus hymeniophilus TaxID=353542 RepID=A0A9P7AY29_9HELO|nr:hypothetical protein D0Z07_3274 [Hyphodiscus hymeniophilus]